MYNYPLPIRYGYRYRDPFIYPQFHPYGRVGGYGSPFGGMPNFPMAPSPYSPYAGGGFPFQYPAPSSTIQPQQPSLAGLQFPQGFTGGQQPIVMKSLLNQFKKKDGTYDINKMMDTAGQMMQAVNQVNALVKGLTSTFKV